MKEDYQPDGMDSTQEEGLIRLRWKLAFELVSLAKDFTSLSVSPG
jgi:hypothetical protein